MKMKRLVEEWFPKWEAGDFLNLSVAENFRHTGPFGIIDGKRS